MRSLSPKQQRLLLALSVVFLGLFFSGCTPMFMAVPPGLQSKTDKMPIERVGGLFQRQQFLFGNFIADDVIRGMRVGGSVRLLGVRMGGARQGYSFELLRRGQKQANWRTRCLIKINVGGVAVGGLSVVARRRRLTCSFRSRGGKRWMLNFGFRDPRSNVREGDILLGKRLIRIAPNFRVEGQPNTRTYSPTGYVFRFNGRTIGAIDLLNGGIVYLRRDLPKPLRAAVSMAAISMLINRNQG